MALCLTLTQSHLYSSQNQRHVCSRRRASRRATAGCARNAKTRRRGSRQWGKSGWRRQPRRTTRERSTTTRGRPTPARRSNQSPSHRWLSPPRQPPRKNHSAVLKKVERRCPRRRRRRERRRRQSHRCQFLRRRILFSRRSWRRLRLRLGEGVETGGAIITKQMQMWWHWQWLCRGCFFNWSAWFSLPKWKNCSANKVVVVGFSFLWIYNFFVIGYDKMKGLKRQDNLR